MIVTLAVLREVMDKEPPLWGLWLVLGGLALVGYGLGRRWRLAGLIALALGGLLAWGTLTELRDPWVCFAIRAEAGVGYAAQAGLLAAAAVLGPLLGLIVGRHRARTAP